MSNLSYPTICERAKCSPDIPGLDVDELAARYERFYGSRISSSTVWRARKRFMETSPAEITIHSGKPL